MISGKFEAIRDDLYLSTYAMEMFSYSTIDNEGRYNILKEQGYDMSTLDKTMRIHTKLSMKSGLANYIKIIIIRHLQIKSFAKRIMLHMAVS